MSHVTTISSCSRSTAEKHTEKVNKSISEYMLHMDGVRTKSECKIGGDCVTRGAMPSGLTPLRDTMKSERASAEENGYTCAGGKADSGPGSSGMEAPFY